MNDVGTTVPKDTAEEILISVPVKQALKLEPGGIYAIVCDFPLSHDAIQRLRGQLEAQESRTGCKLIVLDYGLSIQTK